MSLHLKYLFNLHRLCDEVSSDTGISGGGASGGESDLNVNIDAASDAIGSDLGLNDKGEGTDDLDLGSATPPGDKKPAAPADETAEAKSAREAKERALAAAKPDAAKVAEAKKLLTDKKLDFTGKTDAEILQMAVAALPVGKAMPKAWKKEMDKIWAGLSPEAQAYIDQREAQTEEGFKAQTEVANYGKALKETMQPYEALLTAQGVGHTAAVKAVMNAHYILSTESPEGKAQFMAKLAKNYGVDLAKAVEASAATTVQETPAEKANRERIERLEADRHNEKSQQFAALKAQSAAEVEAFASDPKHPYFNEVAAEIALLLQDPKLSMEDAYGRAIYANPVTREKELARLRQEAEEKARTEAEAKAAAAEKARGTKVRGQEEHRASPDLIGSMDDTLRETMGKIKSRQEG